MKIRLRRQRECPKRHRPKNLPYLDFVEQTLEAESQPKHTRNVRLKKQWAHFPYNKGLDQFDFAFQPSVDERKLRELASLAFLERKENVLLLGPPDVGKTHLAIALGTEAIVTGSSKPKLLILDEMGYLTLDSFAATCLSSWSRNAMKRAPSS